MNFFTVHRTKDSPSVFSGATFRFVSRDSDGRHFIKPSTGDEGIEVSAELLVSKDVLVRSYTLQGRQGIYTTEKLTILRAALAYNTRNEKILVPSTVAGWRAKEAAVWFPDEAVMFNQGEAARHTRSIDLVQEKMRGLILLRKDEEVTPQGQPDLLPCKVGWWHKHNDVWVREAYEGGHTILTHARACVVSP